MQLQPVTFSGLGGNIMVPARIVFGVTGISRSMPVQDKYRKIPPPYCKAVGLIQWFHLWNVSN